MHQLHAIQGQRDLASASGISPTGGDAYGYVQTTSTLALPSPASTASPLMPLASIPLSVLNEGPHGNTAGSFSSVNLLSLLAKVENAPSAVLFGAQPQDYTKGKSCHFICETPKLWLSNTCKYDSPYRYDQTSYSDHQFRGINVDS